MSQKRTGRADTDLTPDSAEGMANTEQDTEHCCLTEYVLWPRILFQHRGQDEWHVTTSAQSCSPPTTAVTHEYHIMLTAPCTRINLNPHVPVIRAAGRSEISSPDSDRAAAGHCHKLTDGHHHLAGVDGEVQALEHDAYHAALVHGGDCLLARLAGREEWSAGSELARRDAAMVLRRGHKD